MRKRQTWQAETQYSYEQTYFFKLYSEILYLYEDE